MSKKRKELPFLEKEEAQQVRFSHVAACIIFKMSFGRIV